MYTLQGYYLKKRGCRTPFYYTPELDTTLENLYVDFEVVVLVLRHTALEYSLYVNIQNLPTDLNPKLYTDTVAMFLLLVGNRTLVHATVPPYTDTVFANWRDGFQAGYDFEITDPNKHPDSETTVEDQTAVLANKVFHREQVDPYELDRQLLFTVNGLLHFSEPTPHGVVLKDAGRSLRNSNRNTVGLLQLGNLGSFKKVPIQQCDISSSSKEQPLKDYLCLKVNPEFVSSLENKTLLLSLGGFLVIPGDCKGVFRTSEDTITIRLSSYPYLRRFFAMLDAVDTSRFTRRLSKTELNSTKFNVNELYEDCTIRDLCTMSQSFFIVLDTPKLIVERQQVEHTGLPGRYVTRSLPEYPLITDDGLMSEYWYRREYDRYLLAVSDHFYNNYNFETTELEPFSNVDSSRLTQKPAQYYDGYFLKLGVQK